MTIFKTEKIIRAFKRSWNSASDADFVDRIRRLGMKDLMIELAKEVDDPLDGLKLLDVMKECENAPNQS